MKKIFIVISLLFILTFTACQKINTDGNNETFNDNNSTSSEKELFIYLVKLSDDGKNGQPVGCGDSLVPIVERISNNQNSVGAALKILFSIKEQNFKNSGLYTVFSNSDLKVEKIEEKNGKILISITGQYIIGGTCDIPRFENQIKKTIEANSEFKNNFQVLLNGQPIEQALNMSGQ